MQLLAQRRRLQGWRRWHLALCSRQFELRVAAIGDRRMRRLGLRCLRRAARAAAVRWRTAVAAWRRALLARCCASWRRRARAWLAWSDEAAAAQAALRLQRGAVRALAAYHARKRHRRRRAAAARRVLEGRLLVRLLGAWRGCVLAKLRVRARGAAVAAGHKVLVPLPFALAPAPAGDPALPLFPPLAQTPTSARPRATAGGAGGGSWRRGGSSRAHWRTPRRSGSTRRAWAPRASSATS